MSLCATTTKKNYQVHLLSRVSRVPCRAPLTIKVLLDTHCVRVLFLRFSEKNSKIIVKLLKKCVKLVDKGYENVLYFGCGYRTQKYIFLAITALSTIFVQCVTIELNPVPISQGSFLFPCCSSRCTSWRV